MVPLLKAGGAGCITATSRLVASDLALVFRHHADPARSAEVELAQARIVAARNRASQLPQIASPKALLAKRTGEAGWQRLRPPLMPVTQDEAAALLAGSVNHQPA